MVKILPKLSKMMAKIGLILIVGSLGVPVLFKTQYTEAVSDQGIIQASNQARLDNGVGLLKWNGDLSSSAWIKANDICNQDYWSHANPQGQISADLIRDEGYDFEFAGENLAKHYESSEKVVSAWLNSSSHRDNLLKPEYTDIGTVQIKCSFQGAETVISVAHYGNIN